MLTGHVLLLDRLKVPDIQSDISEIREPYRIAMQFPILLWERTWYMPERAMRIWYFDTNEVFPEVDLEQLQLYLIE